MAATVSSLRRRNSIDSTVIPTELHIPTQKHSSSFPEMNGNKSSSFPTDFELVSLRSSSLSAGAYTSLKDLIPHSSSLAVSSPTPSSYEIPIKNHLVKQAAWAYLQPMSISPDATNRHPFHRMWVRFSTDYVKNPVKACLSFINSRIIPTISRVLDRVVGAIRIRINNSKW